jgi:RNA polymerase sigma factor (sigma-70 family)
MRSNHGVHLSPAEIEKLAERLTPRRPRRFEGEDLLQDLPAPGEAPDQRLERLQADAERRRIVEALFDQFSELPPEDRLILRMRYLEGLKVVTIARSLDLEQRKLYSRIENLRKTLRARLQSLGISWKSAL